MVWQNPNLNFLLPKQGVKNFPGKGKGPTAGKKWGDNDNTNSKHLQGNRILKQPYTY